ncbi:MAG: hypothetical protein AB1578_23745 [Thermodesulfobacteriota bacterium]
MREHYSNQLAAVTGVLIVLVAMAFAALQSPELGELSPGAAMARAQAVPHGVEGRAQCSRCHGPRGPVPYPVRHLGWSNPSCTRCHAPPVPAAPAADLPRAGAAPLPHPVLGYEACGTCHGPGEMLPYPDDHKGRPDDGCTQCHPATEP